jgi:hypothetical protein
MDHSRLGDIGSVPSGKHTAQAKSQHIQLPTAVSAVSYTNPPAGKQNLTGGCWAGGGSKSKRILAVAENGSRM